LLIASWGEQNLAAKSGTHTIHGSLSRSKIWNSGTGIESAGVFVANEQLGQWLPAEAGRHYL
jgi:hypothetical protein